MSASAAAFPIPDAKGGATGARVSWTLWAGLLAVTSSAVGGTWDVAWHRSIGRDSFLTPAHLCIYACGVSAALVCSYLIFATTFGSDAAAKARAVAVLGFRAPLGAFIAAWGGIAMLTSAPFDNWWHQAYGLDVKIISPPHTLLILGVRCVGFGVGFLILAAMNRACEANEAETFRRLQTMFLYSGGLMIVGQMFFLQEVTWDVMLHQASPYVAMALAIPLMYGMLAVATRSRWACTVTTSIYTAWVIASILLLPLAPAAPKLGPVYIAVTHLVPGKFPILLIVPALALDLLWHRLRGWKPWQIAAVSGVIFVALLVAVEWPFATFLMSKASENRFFGTMYFDYNSPADGLDRLREFVRPQQGLGLATGLVAASVVASVSTWIGLRFGGWMRGIQR